MRPNTKLAFAAVAGTALGAAGIEAINAQSTPPAYVVIEIADVTDPAGFRANSERTNVAAAALFKDYGGRYLARTDKLTTLDGDTPPKRFIVIAFDNLEKAQGWYYSPLQKQVNEIRFKTTRSRAFIVEGQ